MEIAGQAHSFAVGLLVTNVASYVALVLAMPRLTWRRRGWALGLGIAILIGGHLIFAVGVFAFYETVALHPQLPKAVGQLFVTLPFLLWIMLAYGPRARGLFDGRPEPE